MLAEICAECAKIGICGDRARYPRLNFTEISKMSLRCELSVA